MALGILAIIYGVLIVLTILVQFLLYKGNKTTKNNIFIMNMLLALVLSYISYTSFPTNFTGQRIIAVVLAIIAVVGLVIKFTKEDFIHASKIMLSIAVFGSLIQLFL